jgi:hypothetical protein
MIQADSVHSTPRITASKMNSSVDPTRRNLLTIAAAGAVAAAIPTRCAGGCARGRSGLRSDTRKAGG